jgi:AraC family transcriptional regulator
MKMNASVSALHLKHVHALNAWMPSPAPPSPTRLTPPGCLPPWQAKRIHRHIEANLATRLDIAELAGVVGLSTSHFCRVFKRTFGITVHRYVLRLRITMAQQLMLSTADALSSIALTCGMSDQAHLTRWFGRVVGQTPAAWRRAREATQIGLLNRPV